MDSFPPRINATCGKIEPIISDTLDLFFEEVTGMESLASHVLYDDVWGITLPDGKKVNVIYRKEFDALIKATAKKGA